MFVDLHLHADGIPDQDLATLAYFGVRAAVTCARDAGAGSARELRRHWDELVQVQTERLRRAGIRPMVALRFLSTPSLASTLTGRRGPQVLCSVVVVLGVSSRWDQAKCGDAILISPQGNTIQPGLGETPATAASYGGCGNAELLT